MTYRMKNKNKSKYNLIVINSSNKNKNYHKVSQLTSTETLLFFPKMPQLPSISCKKNLNKLKS